MMYVIFSNSCNLEMTLQEMNTEDDSDDSEDDLEKKMIKDLQEPERY